jgi:diguanylate cyclase (GGDEF)-like protein
MTKRLRPSTGLNARQFELALLEDRIDSARRFLPRSAVLAAMGLIVFIGLDIATDPANFKNALRWRILGAILMLLVAALTRLNLGRAAFSALMLVPPTLLVWSVALAATELNGGIGAYAGGIALMLTLGSAWLFRKRTFVAFHLCNLLGLWLLVRTHVNAADLRELLVICLLGSLCGALFFDFIYRLSRRALRLQLELKTESRTDALTGLPNRRAFLERAEDLAQRAKRRGKYIAVLLIDADHFKRINDSLGHDVGDASLQALASALANAMGGPVDCGRLGGEEFAAIAQDLDADAASALAHRLVRQIREFAWGAEGLPKLTVSIGVCCANHCDQLSTLLRCADLALYEAKNAGRNRAVFKSLDLSAQQPTSAIQPSEQ